MKKVQPTEFTNHPTVTVVIPAYRAEQTIERAIRSVLAQTVPVLEIIVVDDGSPDALATIVEQFGPPVRLIQQSNCKSAAARNLGIENASGSYIAFLDADDYWEPDKLAMQLAIFAEHPDVGVVASRYYNQEPGGTREMGGARKDTWFDKPRRESGAAAFLLGTLLWTSTVIIRRELLDRQRFVSGLEPAEDRDLWIRLASQTHVFLLSHPLATAVFEPGSISRGDIACDCSKMLEVVGRHRDLLGPLSSLLWRAYIRYRWAAIESSPKTAIPLLLRSLCGWPAPFVGMPTMQTLGRLRRLIALLKLSVQAVTTTRTVRATS